MSLLVFVSSCLHLRHSFSQRMPIIDADLGDESSRRHRFAVIISILLVSILSLGMGLTWPKKQGRLNLVRMTTDPLSHSSLTKEAGFWAFRCGPPARIQERGSPSRPGVHEIHSKDGNQLTHAPSYNSSRRRHDGQSDHPNRLSEVPLPWCNIHGTDDQPEEPSEVPQVPAALQGTAGPAQSCRLWWHDGLEFVAPEKVLDPALDPSNSSVFPETGSANSRQHLDEVHSPVWSPHTIGGPHPTDTGKKRRPYTESAQFNVGESPCPTTDGNTRYIRGSLLQQSRERAPRYP